MATVTIKDMEYNPARVEITPGESVTWENKDKMRHTATKKDEPCKFDTGAIGAGESKTLKFDHCAPGEYPYICKFHEGMEGTVVIKPKA